MEKRTSAHYQRMGGINSFDLSRDGQTLVTTGQDRKITYWNLNHTNPVKMIDTSENP